jgi:hypothetical protein
MSQPAHVKPSIGAIDTLLHGAGQVMFQNYPDPMACPFRQG